MLDFGTSLGTACRLFWAGNPRSAHRNRCLLIVRTSGNFLQSSLVTHYSMNSGVPLMWRSWFFGLSMPRGNKDIACVCMCVRVDARAWCCNVIATAATRTPGVTSQRKTPSGRVSVYDHDVLQAWPDCNVSTYSTNGNAIVHHTPNSSTLTVQETKMYIERRI